MIAPMLPAPCHLFPRCDQVGWSSSPSLTTTAAAVLASGPDPQVIRWPRLTGYRFVPVPLKTCCSLSSSLAKMSLNGSTAQQRSISNSAVNPRANGANTGKTSEERIAKAAAAGTGSQCGVVDGAAKINEKPQSIGRPPVSRAPHAVKTVKQSLAPPAPASTYVSRVVRDDPKAAGTKISPGLAPRPSGFKVTGQQQKQVYKKQTTAK